MAVSVDQFGKSLVASGLLTAEDVKALWNAIPAEGRPKDGDGFAQLLIDSKKLTPFQAAELLAGRGARLIMGDYTIVSQIGAGGMGQVYKAQHRRMKRTVALKVMSNAAMQDEAAVKRFQREVHAAARLEHPNIVTAYDSGEAGSVKYLVMQFVDGGDLSDLVKKNGRLGIEQAVGYVIQAAKGLAFAHGEGVIHRDIKPANLLLDKKGVVKILDMGLARFEDGGDGLTATEQVMGTVDYMSPEQAANTKGCDGRADIYSLGCTLWYLLTAKKLYEADTLIARLMLHRDGPIPSLVKERDDVPWPLEQALHKMIAKQMQDRYQAMDEVVAALEPHGDGNYGGSSGGMVSSNGGGKAQSAELASFMQSMKSGTGKPAVQAPAAQPTTSPQVDATAAFTVPEADTDPKSELLRQPAPVGSASSSLLRVPVKQAKSGKNPPIKLIAAGVAGFLFLLLGVWVIVRDKDGQEVARVKVPEGGTATVQTTPAPPNNTAAPKPTLPATSVVPPSSPTKLVTPTTASPVPPPLVSPIAASATIPAEALTFAGHRYLLVPTNDVMTWDEVKAKAEAMGGHLATITTQAEYDWVRDNIYNEKHRSIRGPNSARVFMGAIQTAADSEPKWITGEASEFRPWFETKRNQSQKSGNLAVVWNVKGLTAYVTQTATVAGSFLVEWDTFSSAIGTSQGSVPPLAKAPFDAAQAKAHQDAWAKYLGVPVETTNSAGMKLVVIPPGEFTMERMPVTLTKPFRFGVHEVSQGQWKTVMATEPWKGQNKLTAGDKYPAGPVTWHDAVAFCEKLTAKERSAGRIQSDQEYRLPTEAEWEFACRAGTTTERFFGKGEEDLGLYAWFMGNAMDAGKGYQEIGLKKPNQWGLYDILGNVQEWCHDYMGDITGGTDPQGPATGDNRCAKGGGYNAQGFVVHSRFRFGMPPQGNGTSPAGLRVVLSSTARGAAPAVMTPPAAALHPQPDTTPHEASVVSMWEHKAGSKPLEILKLYSNGRINSPDGKDTWATQDNTLVLTWPTPAATAGAWKDQCTFSPDGNSYAGFGYGKRPIAGKRLPLDGATPKNPRQGTTPPLAVAPFDATKAKQHQQLWASHLKTEVVKPNSIGMQMTLIPPGEFLMGSTDEQVEAALKAAEEAKADQRYKDLIEKTERPQHKVVITKPLLMSATEVTVGQFKQFAAATKYQTEAEKEQFKAKTSPPLPTTPVQPPPKPIHTYLNPGYVVSDDYPASAITWNDAVAYCNWLSTQEKLVPCYRADGNTWQALPGTNGYRLPTEAEWEYACRAGTTTQYSFGDDHEQLAQYGWHNKNAANHPHSVGTKSPNPFGLYDMHGNLKEWCGDYWDGKGYAKTSLNDPVGSAAGSTRTVRGAYWYNDAHACRSASRSSNLPSTLSNQNGFRCVRVVDASTSMASVTPQPAVPAAAPGKLFMHDPAFPQWMKGVQAMPAEQQIEAVSKKLVELNPGFDGKLMGQKEIGTPKIENGMVTELNFSTENATDISPVRALVGLKSLWCGVSSGKKGRLSDLSPLGGMGLTFLNCNDSQVTDLSPLKGMPLSTLYCTGTVVTDLSPLQGMQKLTLLACHGSPVSDLSPLQGLPLKKLHVAQTRVTDVSPLAACKTLTELYVRGTKVTPASVAALQQVLPGCKIEWDDPAKATTQPAASGTK